MIYFIYGTDTFKSRKKLHELLDIAQKKRSGSELFKINTENWSESKLDELIVSQGLFEQKYTIVLDNLFEKKDAKDFILSKLEDMKKSSQIFLMLEGRVSADVLKKIEKNAEKVQVFEKREESANKQESNIFSITNGLINKDKKRLWIDYRYFVAEGIPAEEIHGIFFWQIKNMILASKAKSQKETGLSPFVYKNALSGGRKYNIDELIDMSDNLVQMTHRVRQGDGELEIMMEKWVLSL